MKIDWFTVIAQVLNFLLLVWLLKRFLYKPILNAIEAREKKVADQLSDAESKKMEASRELTEYQQKNAAFDQRKESMLSQAVTQSNEEKQRLLEQVRKQADDLRFQLQKAAKEQEGSLEKEIAEKAKQEVFAIARKALRDLATQDLEEQLVKRFIEKLNELSQTLKQQLNEMLQSDQKEILVKSAFDLTEKQKEEIKNELKKIHEGESLYQFETSPQLISGIELSVNGYKVSWSISEYLNSLEKNISDALREKTKVFTQT